MAGGANLPMGLGVGIAVAVKVVLEAVPSPSPPEEAKSASGIRRLVEVNGWCYWASD